MRHRLYHAFCLVALGAVPVFADTKPPEEKSPSRDKVQWLGAKTSLETTAQMDYVLGGRTSLGNGNYGDVSEKTFWVRQLITRRCLRAFLLRGGVEWQRFSFNRSDDAILPSNLHALNAYLAMDFRFSRKDMIRVQARPGLYTDYENPDIHDMNTPFAVGYSHMVSHKFQWALGLSINRWRDRELLGGGGFRWQINDRWKIKGMLPEPAIEYKARDDLHIFVMGDFRSDTFRVSSDFGSRRGIPALDNALMDYQEIRVGAGFSWNVRPLIELNFHAGYMLDRAFNYHNNGLLLTSEPSPYFTLNLQMLFEVWKDAPSLDTKGPQFEIPDLERVLPNVQKVFEN